MEASKPNNIDEYICGFPDDVQERLQQVRDVIKQVAPEATEAIKYGIPTFVLRGNLVHFAAFQNHIGFYPTPAGIKEFETDLAAYKTGKGSIQFPFDRPLPLELIKRMTEHRVNKNLQKD